MDDALHEVIEELVAITVVTATVAEAITQLSQVSQPCLVVVEPESRRYLGVFTERDGLCQAAQGLDTSSQTLSAHLQPYPALRQSDLGSWAAIATRFDQQLLPALPVVNDAGQPVGLVTLRSLWRHRPPSIAPPISPASAPSDRGLESAQGDDSDPQAVLRELRQAEAHLQLFFAQSLEGFFFYDAGSTRSVERRCRQEPHPGLCLCPPAHH